MKTYTFKDVVDYWKKLNIKTIDDYKNYLESFIILFSYNSLFIENKNVKYNDVRSIFDNGKIINYTGDLKTLYEINNQKDCYEFILNKLSGKEKVSEELIQEIHKLLTKGTYDEKRYITNNERPGEYKKHDYVVGKDEIGANVNEVKELMIDLINQINEVNTNDIEDIITIASFTHNTLEEIHPFADGNGRVGRTLLNYILMLNDLPPIIIYEEDKNYYYEALEKFDKENNLNPSIEFFKYEMEKTWSKTLNESKQKNRLLKYYL